jgi:hypothetical protein
MARKRESAADRKARITLQAILDDGHTDSASATDDATAVTVLDCSQCVQAHCWDDVETGSLDYPPQCIPVYTITDLHPDPVLPPPLNGGPSA